MAASTSLSILDRTDKGYFQSTICHQGSLGEFIAAHEIINAIRDKNVKELFKDPTLSCSDSLSHSYVLKFAPEIKECPCCTLSRLKQPKLRLRYENVVSRAICKQIEKPEKSIVSITLFATGSLFSELFLLARVLLDLPQSNNKPLVVNFIDLGYDFDQNQPLKKAAESCLKLLRPLVSPGMKVDARFFHSRIAYESTENSPDICAGCDVDASKLEYYEMFQKCGSPGSKFFSLSRQLQADGSDRAVFEKAVNGEKLREIPLEERKDPDPITPVCPSPMNIISRPEKRQ